MSIKALCGVLVLVTGCTAVPKPSPYPFSSQHQMQAAHHWQMLAGTVAARAAIRLQQAGLTSAGYVLYVVPSDASLFGTVFPNLLVTELKHLNIPASLEQAYENSPLRLESGVQPVIHQANRNNPSLPLGWLAGGVVLLVASPFVDVSPALGIGPLSHSEIIITTQLRYTPPSYTPPPIGSYSREGPVFPRDPTLRSDPVLQRDNDLYYINNEDLGHYSLSPSLPPTKSYTVVNG